MSKPKRRTMRRLKRTLGVTALILALLIAMIPDFGEAAGDTPLSVIWDDPIVDKLNGEIRSDSISVIGETIGKGSSGQDHVSAWPAFRLRVTEAQLMSDSTYYDGYETQIYEFQFGLERLRKKGEVNDGTDGSSETTIWTGNGAQYESVKNSEGSYFSYDLNFVFHSIVQNDTQYYASAYYYIPTEDVNGNLTGKYSEAYHVNGGMETTAGHKDIDEGVQMSVYFDNVPSRIRVRIYVNQNPKTTLIVDDERFDQGSEERSRYFISDVEGNKDPVTSQYLKYENVDFSDGLRSMHYPSTDTRLKIKETDPKRSAADLASLGLVAESGAALLESYSDKKIDLMDSFSVKIQHKPGSDGDAYDENTPQTFVDVFNDYKINMTFPVSNVSDDAPYPYLKRNDINGDEYRMAYHVYNQAKGIEQWYDTNVFAGRSLNSDESLVTFTKVFDANVDEVIFYIARGNASLSVLDRRSDIYNNAADVGFWANETDNLAALDRNAFVIVNTYEPQTGETVMLEKMDALKKSKNSTLYETATTAIKVNISASENGTTNDWIASDGTTGWTDFSWSGSGGLWLKIGVPENMDIIPTLATMEVYGKRLGSDSWDANPIGSADSTNPDVAINGLSRVRFYVNPAEYESQYILFYYVPKDSLQNQSLTEADNRADKGNTTGATLEVLKSTQPAGNYYLVVNDYDASNTSIPDKISGFDGLSEYNKRVYYNVFIATLEENGTFTEVNRATYNKFGKMNLTLTLPSSWTNANIDNVRLLTEYSDTKAVEEITPSYVSGGKISFDVSHFSVFGVFYKSNASSDGGDDPVTPVEDDAKYDLTVVDTSISKSSGVATAKTRSEEKGDWTLYIQNESSPNILERLIKSDEFENVATNDSTVVVSYKIYLMRDGEYIDATNENAAEIIGDEKIDVVLSLPAKITNVYQGNDNYAAVTMWAYDGTYSPYPIGFGSHGENSLGNPTVKFTIGKNELLNFNPYTLVYTPSSSSSTGTEGDGTNDNSETLKIREYEKRDTDEKENAAFPEGTIEATTLWNWGEPTAKTTIPIGDGEKLEILVSEYPAANDTDIEIGKAIRAGSPYYKSTSTIMAYDIKLKKTDANGVVTFPSTEEELGGTVTLTIPYKPGVAANSGTIMPYTLKPKGSLEALASSPTTASDGGGTITFSTKHFSQYAILYTPGEAQSTSTDSTSNNNGTGSASASTTASTSSSNASNSATNSGANGSNTGSSGATNGSSNSSGTGSNSTGGGGNRAGGDSSVDMPKTADATTYKAIFILILLAFGAFELISSMPARKKARTQGKN